MKLPSPDIWNDLIRRCDLNAPLSCDGEALFIDNVTYYDLKFRIMPLCCNQQTDSKMK